MEAFNINDLGIRHKVVKLDTVEECKTRIQELTQYIDALVRMLDHKRDCPLYLAEELHWNTIKQNELTKKIKEARLKENNKLSW
jgi:hypothetical protein